jgi:hypothetical protein
VHIIYTYYNNYDLFMEVVEHYNKYPQIIRKGFTFSVIDDGSQDAPLTKENLPNGWNGYRIEEDRGWGNEVARNIMGKINTNEWMCFIDMDYVIPFENLGNIILMTPERLKDLGGEQRCTWGFKTGGRTEYGDFTKVIDSTAAVNTFVIKAETWLSTHGYDMALGYIYGIDPSLARQINTENHMPDTSLQKIALQASPSDTRHAPGDQSVYEPLKEFIKERVKDGDMHYSGPSNWPLWKDESTRQRFHIKMPDVTNLNI